MARMFSEEKKTPISKKLRNSLLLSSNEEPEQLYTDKDTFPWQKPVVEKPTEEAQPPSTEVAEVPETVKMAQETTDLPTQKPKKPTAEGGVSLVDVDTNVPAPILQKLEKIEDPVGEADKYQLADDEYKAALADAMAAYKATKDQQDSAKLWEAIIQGVGHLAAGIIGMREGLDLSGLKFSKTDWAAEHTRAQEDLKQVVANLKDQRIMAQTRLERDDKTRQQNIDNIKYNNSLKQQAYANAISQKQLELQQQQAQAERGLAERKFTSAEEQAQFERDLAEKQFTSKEEQAAFERDSATKQYILNKEIAAFEQGLANRKFASAEKQSEFARKLEQQKLDLAKLSTAYDQGLADRKFAKEEKESEFSRSLAVRKLITADKITAFEQDLASKKFVLDEKKAAELEKLNNELLSLRKQELAHNIGLSEREFGEKQKDSMFKRYLSLQMHLADRMDAAHNKGLAEGKLGLAKEDSKFYRKLAEQKLELETEKSERDRMLAEKEAQQRREQAKLASEFAREKFGFEKDEAERSRDLEERRLALAEKEQAERSRIRRAAEASRIAAESQDPALKEGMKTYQEDMKKLDDLRKSIATAGTRKKKNELTQMFMSKVMLHETLADKLGVPAYYSMDDIEVDKGWIFDTYEVSEPKRRERQAKDAPKTTPAYTDEELIQALSNRLQKNPNDEKALRALRSLKKERPELFPEE